MRLGTPHLGLLWSEDQSVESRKTGLFALRRARLPLPERQSAKKAAAVAASWDPRPAAPPPADHLRYLQLLPDPAARRSGPPPLPEDVTRLERPRRAARRPRPSRKTPPPVPRTGRVKRQEPRAATPKARATLAMRSAVLGRPDASAIVTNEVPRQPAPPMLVEELSDAYDPFGDDRVPRPFWATRTFLVGALVALVGLVVGGAGLATHAWNDAELRLADSGPSQEIERIEVTVRPEGSRLHGAVLATGAGQAERRPAPESRRAVRLSGVKGRGERVPLRTVEPIDRGELSDLLAAGMRDAARSRRVARQPARVDRPSTRPGVDPEEILAAALDTSSSQASSKSLDYEAAPAPSPPPPRRQSRQPRKRKRPPRFANGISPQVPAWMR